MTSREESTSQVNETPIGFSAHNHSKCVQQAVSKAEAICQSKGLRFTPVRRKVLEILLEEHKAIGAYDILSALRTAGYGSQPPVAYRALEFLTENGFAHKVESLNAFVACAHSDEIHTPAFMICRVCDAVAEAQSPPQRSGFGKEADAMGFQIEKTVVEAQGICPACAETALE